LLLEVIGLCDQEKNMELRHLRYFVAVAEALSFRKAAIGLHIAQPAISQQIAALESELGVLLFSRGRSRITLTNAGRIFTVEAKRILDQTEKSIQLARAVSRNELGSIRLGYTRYAGFIALPRLLRAVSEILDHVHIDFHIAPVTTIVRQLEEAGLDIGIVRTPLKSALLDSIVLQEDPLVAIVYADHPLARETSINLSELEDDFFVTITKSSGGLYSDLTRQACVAAGFTPKIYEEADSLEGTLGLVSAKRCVALIPQSIAKWSSAGFASAQLSNCAFSADLALAWRRDTAPPITHLFVSSFQKFRERSM